MTASGQSPSKTEQFHDLLFCWRSGRVVVQRRREMIAEFNEIVSFKVVEQIHSCEQHMMLMRLTAKSIDWQFFVDYDGIQTNLREVDSSLRTLQEVILWLLPEGYFARQGDVGVYLTNLPSSNLTDVPWITYADVFSPVLKRRHMVLHPEHCQFFRSGRRFFLRALCNTQLTHPEHELILLPAGDYEVKGARGISYPILQNVRPFRGSPLFH